ncbi:hypothetical protein CBL_02531 [Carabus blaptoides fortunei]
MSVILKVRLQEHTDESGGTVQQILDKIRVEFQAVAVMYRATVSKLLYHYRGILPPMHVTYLLSVHTNRETSYNPCQCDLLTGALMQQHCSLMHANMLVDIIYNLDEDSRQIYIQRAAEPTTSSSLHLERSSS